MKTSIVLAGVLVGLGACAPPPPIAPPRLPLPTPEPSKPAPPPAPPLAEVQWAPEISDDEGVTLGGVVAGGADSIEAAVVSVSCPSAKIGLGQIVGDQATLRLEASDIAAAVQCRGLRVTLTRAGQSTTTVVPFDISMQLAAGVAGGIGISRTTNSPDAVLAIPGSSASSSLAIGKEIYVARKVGGGNAEFAIPILALARAALHRQHAVATTGLAPIDYTPGITIAGRSVPSEAAAEPAPAH